MNPASRRAALRIIAETAAELADLDAYDEAQYADERADLDQGVIA